MKKRRYIILSLIILALINLLFLQKFSELFIESPYGNIPLVDHPPWGMTQEKLFKAKGQPYKKFDWHKAACYRYKEEKIINLPASVVYCFDDNKLSYINLRFQTANWSRSQWDEFRRNLRSHLIVTFGRKHHCDFCPVSGKGWANCLSYFGNGKTYGVMRSETPSGFHSVTEFELHDGQSTGAVNACGVYRLRECRATGADELCYRRHRKK